MTSRRRLMAVALISMTLLHGHCLASQIGFQITSFDSCTDCTCIGGMPDTIILDECDFSDQFGGYEQWTASQDTCEEGVVITFTVYTDEACTVPSGVSITQTVGVVGSNCSATGATTSASVSCVHMVATPTPATVESTIVSPEARCVDREQNCHRCTNATTCDFCRNSHYLHDGKCIASCPSGFEGRGFGVYRRRCVQSLGCVDRRDNCHQCVNDTTCEFCRNKHHLLDGVCVETCPAGYRPQGHGTYRRECVSDRTCVPRWHGCHACASATACGQCRDQMYLHEGACVVTCPDGFLGQGTGNFNRRCVPAGCVDRMRQCHRCVDSSTCEFCRNRYYLLDGVCVASCPPTHTHVGQGNFRRRCVPI